MLRKAATKTLPALSLLLVLSFLAGCGRVEDPMAMLQDTARNSRAEASMHAQMNATLTPEEGAGGLGLNIQGDAWLDMDATVVEARFTVMGMELSLRYVDGTAYLQMGGTWYEIGSGLIPGVGPGALGAAVEMFASFPDILTCASEVNEVGEEEVGGLKCVVLEVVPDLAAISNLESVRKLADELYMTPQEIEEYLADAEPEMKVSVEKGKLFLRKIYIAANPNLSGLGSVGGLVSLPEKACLELSIQIPEYGAAVEVQPPAEVKPFQGL